MEEIRPSYQRVKKRVKTTCETRQCCKLSSYHRFKDEERKMEIAKNKKSRKSESHFCRVLLARKFFMIERLVVMNLDEIKRKLIAEGLFPIHVEGSPLKDEEEKNGFVFIGDLDEFIEATKALKAEALFIVNGVFDNDFFEYEPESESDYEQDDDENHDKPIYLPSVIPEIKSFEKYIGQDYAIKLSVIMANNELHLFTETSWFAKFMSIRMEYTDVIENRIEESKELARSIKNEEVKAKQDGAINKLRDLIHDSVFVRLSTQKAMMAYALENIPDLEYVMTIRTEIQTLKAKIESMGLNRKR